MAEQGRLPRESNPVPGERPGFTASHKAADGTYQETGVGNPLPSKLYAEDANGNKIPVKVGVNGELHTQLTGSVADELLVFSVTVPNDNRQYWSYSDPITSEYNNIDIFAQSDIPFIIDIQRQVGAKWYSINEYRETGVLKVMERINQNTVRIGVFPLGVNDQVTVIVSGREL